MLCPNNLNKPEETETELHDEELKPDDPDYKFYCYDYCCKPDEADCYGRCHTKITILEEGGGQIVIYDSTTDDETPLHEDDKTVVVISRTPHLKNTCCITDDCCSPRPPQYWNEEHDLCCAVGDYEVDGVTVLEGPYSTHKDYPKRLPGRGV